MVHELDVRADFFIEILEGKKTHEIRQVKETRFLVGDILELNEVDIFSKKYTSRKLKAQVSHVTPLELGSIYRFAILSIAVLEGENI